MNAALRIRTYNKSRFFLTLDTVVRFEFVTTFSTDLSM